MSALRNPQKKSNGHDAKLTGRFPAAKLIVQVCCMHASARVVWLHSRYVIALAWTDIPPLLHKMNAPHHPSISGTPWTATTPYDKQRLGAELCFRRLEVHVRAFLVSQPTLCLRPCKCVPAMFCCSNAVVSLKIPLKTTAIKISHRSHHLLDSITVETLHCVFYIQYPIVF